MTRNRLHKSANIILAVAIGYAAVTWARVGWEREIPFRMWVCEATLPFWTNAVMKLCVAVMAYGLVRSLAGAEKAVWFIRAGLGIALFSILTRDLYVFYKSGFEWIVFPNTTLDIAMVGMVFLLAQFVLLRVRPD